MKRCEGMLMCLTKVQVSVWLEDQAGRQADIKCERGEVNVSLSEDRPVLFCSGPV